MSKTCYTVEEASSIVECVSDDEEEAEIVIVLPDNKCEVTDEENEKSEDGDGIREVAGKMEVHLQKEDENSDNVKTAPKRKKLNCNQKYKWKKTFEQISEPSSNLQPESLIESYSLLKDKQPVELFELFYEKDVLGLIVVKSNWYTAQNGAHNFNLTKEKLKLFLATLILSGYHTLPK